METHWVLGWAGVFALAYLLGSIPFGLILTRLAGAGDLRAIGSGNIGATNVLRTGRKDLAAATLFLDALKGAVGVLIGGALAPHGELIAALGAFLGHVAPIWLRFRGGKGVATFIGALLAVHGLSGLSFCLIWLAAAKTSGYSSLAALIASGATPVLLALFGRFDAALVFTALSALLWWKHRDNIERLRAGTESRIGEKS
ncbi:MAG TPA: glycerol-3-phosphate 1-O-acyltransferase PlsY [Methylocystis sp.]|nr:glycerol-3-phosphate 1-O-acyltransferase PlsY [Methylocystis sp.]